MFLCEDNGRISSYPHISQSSRPHIVSSISSQSPKYPTSSYHPRIRYDRYDSHNTGLPNTATNPLALLQQQSLLTQQAAFNRLRTTNPLLGTINNNINLNIANTNLGSNTINPIISNAANNNNNNNNNMNTATSNSAKLNLSQIPSELLQSTINELKQVMTNSNQQSAVTEAINAAFIKLGANDPESKRMVLEQLVAACGGQTAINNVKNNNNDKDERDNNNEKESKKSKKKRSKSRTKKSKKKKKDKDRKHRRHKKRDREEDKDDRKKRRSKRRSRERDRERSRDRSRDTRSRSGHRSESENETNIELSVSVEPQETQNGNNNNHLRVSDAENMNHPNSASSGTDFPDPEDEDTVIHVNIVNDKKRKLPVPIQPIEADFPLESPPPNKRQRISTHTSPNSVSASPTPPNRHK